MVQRITRQTGSLKSCPHSKDGGKVQVSQYPRAYLTREDFDHHGHVPNCVIVFVLSKVHN